MASMIEFTDILLGSTLPLHSYLNNRPRLSLRLVTDGKVCGETPAVNGDLTNGIWEINSRLSACTVKHSVTLAVVSTVAGKSKCLKFQFAAVTLSVTELLGGLKAQPYGPQTFYIVDSRSSIQIVMTCLIKASPYLLLNNPPSDVGTHDNHTADSHTRDTQSDNDPDSSELPSRETLESLYAKVTLMQDREERKARGLSMLGRAYLAIYRKERGRADLERAVALQEEALQCTGPFHPRLVEHSHRFSLALMIRCEQTGDVVDIERAVSHLQNALSLTEDSNAEKPGLLSSLGTAFQLRFDRLGDLPDMQNAISFMQKAVDITPDGQPEKAVRLSDLGATLVSRFGRTGSLTDIEDGISNFRRAIEQTLDGDPGKPSLFSNLGAALQFRFGRLGGLEDLKEAIDNLQQAIRLTPKSHHDKPTLLNNLGNALQVRFDRLGNLADLEDAILQKQMAVGLMPDGHPNKPSLFNNLGNALETRFGRLGNLVDLENAISNEQKAVDLTPDDNPDKPGQLSNLGNALETRFDRLGNLADLEDAILHKQKAVKLMPDGHPDKPSILSNLGNALETRFGRLGNLVDLENAVSNKQQAVNLTADDDPDKPGQLHSLGNALETRFDRLGNLADLEDAIMHIQKAVKLMPDGHPNKPSLFTDLGSALETRFNRLGNLADSENAISNKQKAVDLTPDDNPDKLGQLSNLGNALEARFKRLGNLADLENAVSNKQKAVDLTPDDNPDKPVLLSNLGSALEARFKRLGDLKDLEDAIENFRKALRLTPDDHHGKSNLLSNISSTLLHRFLRLKSLSDLEDAISNVRKAVELAPDGHPDKGDRLHNLGNALITRFDHLNTISDLESALFAYSTAAKSINGSAMHRFKAARAWAKYSEQNSRSPLEAFSCAIDLLPRIAWLGLAVTDQHALLADIGAVVRDAVAAAIRYEEYETAVVWVEQGRSIVWQNLLGLRSPVEDLRGAHPELADRLQNIAQQLEGFGSRQIVSVKTQITSSGDVHTNHLRWAIEWDNLVDEIRRIPKFETFLKAKSFSQLAPAAWDGPVVILNVNDSQCDALILIADDSSERTVSAINIPLERFSHEKSQKMFQTLMSLLTDARVRVREARMTGRQYSQTGGETKFKSILRVLWQDVVKPVIEGLAFQTQSERPPRIWWCATGLLAFLPIHAAGVYDTEGIGEKLSDYVVSSYTPTLNAILELSEPDIQADFQVLTVAQALAPGAQPIPKTEDEVKIVQAITTGARALNLTRETATVQRVRDGMMESNWIHLACHGQQNPVDPMESGFLLHDEMLKLSEIVKMSLPKADFAFLSACQTAMGDEKVTEESVHLAAGMLLSGCRGVIATTWSIRDDDGPMIAQEVYTRMFKDRKPNRKEAAYALHEAVKVLRDSGAQCVSWVPFIHIGR